jgi:hypothetical protein
VIVRRRSALPFWEALFSSFEATRATVNNKKEIKKTHFVVAVATVVFLRASFPHYDALLIDQPTMSELVFKARKLTSITSWIDLA